MQLIRPELMIGAVVVAPDRCTVAIILLSGTPPTKYLIGFTSYLLIFNAKKIVCLMKFLIITRNGGKNTHQMLFATTKQATEKLWRPIVATLENICDEYGGDVHVSLVVRAKRSHFTVLLFSEKLLGKTERFWCILGHKNHNKSGYSFQLLDGGPATLSEIGDALTSEEHVGDAAWINGKVTVEFAINDI